MATQKFRPVLTQAQISEIASMCKANEANPNHPEAVSILRVMIPMLAKINVGAITPSYSISPESEKKRVDLEMRARYNDGLMTPEEESRYEKDILGI